MRPIPVMLLLWPLLLAASVPPLGAAAPLYQWVDEGGETHITDDPTTIPERYRSRTGPSAAPAPPASAPGDSLEGRRAAAEHYLALVPMDGMIADSIRRLAAQMPEDKRRQFEEVMTRLTRRDSINNVTRDSLVKHFTVREIEALTRFYGSLEGQSILKKFSAYMADVAPAIQSEILRAARESGQGQQ